MVGDHSHRNRVVVVAHTRELLDLLHDRPEEADAIHVRTVDGCRGDPLETAAVVDVLLGKQRKPVVGLAVLHEHRIADLHVLTAIGVLMRVLAESRVVLHLWEVVEDLAVRSAGVADGHRVRTTGPRPPVLVAVIGDPRALVSLLVALFFGQQHHSVRRDTGLGEQLGPDVRALVVAGDAVFGVPREHRHVDPVRIKSDDLGQEMPEQRDLLGLEVVAQAPVAEHLEKGGVPVVADFLDVLRPKAGLRVGEPVAVRMFGAQQVSQQRLHPAAGEECGGVVLRHQRGPVDEGVAALLHQREVGAADFIGIHPVTVPSSRPVCAPNRRVGPKIVSDTGNG